MSENDGNIYKTARHLAGLTQETASSYLHVSVESLSRYERGHQTPPDDVVRAMCDLYESPSLAAQHLRASSELGRQVLPPVEQCDLQTATIRLINRVLRFADMHRDRQLLAIAEDGVITPDEQPIFDEILGDMEAIVIACTELKTAREASE